MPQINMYIVKSKPEVINKIFEKVNILGDEELQKQKDTLRYFVVGKFDSFPSILELVSQEYVNEKILARYSTENNNHEDGYVFQVVNGMREPSSEVTVEWKPTLFDDLTEKMARNQMTDEEFELWKEFKESSGNYKGWH